MFALLILVIFVAIIAVIFNVDSNPCNPYIEDDEYGYWEDFDE